MVYNTRGRYSNDVDVDLGTRLAVGMLHFGDKPENVNIQGISMPLEVRMLPCASLFRNVHISREISS